LEFWSKGSGSQGFIGRIGDLGVFRSKRFYEVPTVRLNVSPLISVGVDVGTGGVDVNADEWHHYAVTHDGVTTAKMFVDGVEYLTAEGAWEPGDLKVYLGESPGRSYDEAAVFNRALTQTEIAAHANRNPAQPIVLDVEFTRDDTTASPPTFNVKLSTKSAGTNFKFSLPPGVTTVTPPVGSSVQASNGTEAVWTFKLADPPVSLKFTVQRSDDSGNVSGSEIGQDTVPVNLCPGYRYSKSGTKFSSICGESLGTATTVRLPGRNVCLLKGQVNALVGSCSSPDVNWRC
jgi:Concanavalin A-like lectin/glucanases superfamily